MAPLAPPGYAYEQGTRRVIVLRCAINDIKIEFSEFNAPSQFFHFSFYHPFRYRA